MTTTKYKVAFVSNWFGLLTMPYGTCELYAHFYQEIKMEKRARISWLSRRASECKPRKKKVGYFKGYSALSSINWQLHAGITVELSIKYSRYYFDVKPNKFAPGTWFERMAPRRNK